MAAQTISDILQRGVGLTSKLGRQLVSDFADASETGDYKPACAKYRLTPQDCEIIPANKALTEAIKAERKRRARKSAKTTLAVSNIVELHPMQQLIDNQDLIVDLCRYRESLVSEIFIRRKYRLDNATWERLGSDEGDALVEKIEEGSMRRRADGSMKRELAQKHVVRAPTVLAGIMDDQSANARHRIDSAKVLNDLSTNGPAGSTPDTTRFIISINLSAGGEEHVLHYNKSRTPLAPGEKDPDDSSDVNMAAIAMKPTESGGGENTI
jgi:hypothetical protein